MSNLIYSLPIELTRYIYEYDPTYKGYFNNVLRFIYEMEICTCSGKHPPRKLSFKDRVMYCRNCPMHRPRYYYYRYVAKTGRSIYESFFNNDDFTYYDYNGNEVEIEFKYTRPEPYYQSNFCENRKYICNQVGFYIPQKSIKIINNKHRRRGRFMDMGHYQRREV